MLDDIVRVIISAHLRVNGSWTHHTRFDTVGSPFIIRGLGKADNTKFGGAVRSTVGVPKFAGDRRDVDDMSGFSLAHVTEHCLCAEEDTFEVNRDIQIPILLTNLGNWVVNSDTRVANENIDPAESIERLFHHHVYL